MKTAIYGGSFSPPHLGHAEVVKTVSEVIRPDRFLIIPDNIPPHKELAENSPSPEARFEMCRLAFGGFPGTEISDLELRREGKSYTSDTISSLRSSSPEDELFLIIGTDMLSSFETWHMFEYLFEECTILVAAREDDDREELEALKEQFAQKYGAKIIILPHEPVEISSTQVRALLKNRGGREYLNDAVYSYIIRNRLFDAQPDFEWLREKAYELLAPKRVLHVQGCEEEAVRLARRWGGDSEKAAVAAILHDITKRLKPNEQLNLIRKYDIVCDDDFLTQPKLFHAVTGAALAKDLFGVSDEISRAIFRHTTGMPEMTLLEKIIYLADYIEPTRDFEGVEKLRKLCYEDLDRALALALEMSLEEVRSNGTEPYRFTKEACAYYKALVNRQARKPE